jgi:hypothetical protein
MCIYYQIMKIIFRDLIILHNTDKKQWSEKREKKTTTF